MIKCTLCAATAPTAARAPQENGWTQIQVHGPSGNRYLSACPLHGVADISAWVKTAVHTVKR